MCKPGDNPPDVTREANTMEQRDGVIERRVGNQGPWKWIATALLGVVMFLLGAFVGDFAASLRYSALDSRLHDHTLIEGHPVLVQRVAGMSESLDRIEAEQQRQSEILREIEQNTVRNNDR